MLFRPSRDRHDGTATPSPPAEGKTMIPSNPLGILSGLASALGWGTGDFVGGVAARRASQFKVVALSALAGLSVLIPAAVLAGGAFPSGRTIPWSLAAGVSGAGGVAALDHGRVP